MGLFSDMLKDDETLFKIPEALDFSYIPKIMKYREGEQRQVAACIKPLYNHRDGRNIFISGQPGIGKTLAVRKVLEEIEEDPEVRDEEVVAIYVNCWQKNTSYKIIVQICEALGYKFTQNKKTEELFRIIERMLNKKCAVFCFDEVDKLEEMDFIYSILERIYRKSIVLITNSKDWILGVEQRIKSRLAPEILEFRAYNQQETGGIISQRAELAFHPGVMEKEALEMIKTKAYEKHDIRSGLHLMKESGNAAEARASRKITPEHVKKAMEKLDFLSVNKDEELGDEEKFVLALVKKDSGKKIGDLYQLYRDEGGEGSYKTFQRKIKKLADGKFITAKKISGGSEGTTTIVNYLRTKKITEF